MSARTFAEWKAYCLIEPFGAHAEFWRAGMLASMTANVNRKKGKKAFIPEDFMPKDMVQQEPNRLEDPRTAHMIRERMRGEASMQKVSDE